MPSTSSRTRRWPSDTLMLRNFSFSWQWGQAMEYGIRAQQRLAIHLHPVVVKWPLEKCRLWLLRGGEGRQAADPVEVERTFYEQRRPGAKDAV
ncbi:MAG: hypothetical protein Q4F13_09355 [Pseudomonadota bacterium]|nr:hypothetical protein [Pseudomonadota bacterium]